MPDPTPTPNVMPGATAAPPAAPASAPAAAAAAASPAPAAAPTPPAAPEPPDNRPPWEKSGEPFDPERAWNLLQNKTKDLADLKAKTDPIVTEWEKLRRASQTELDRANEDIGTLTGERDSWRTRALRADAKALADRFIDADAALALIGDLTQFAGPDGVDTAKLTARFDQLAADKPNLVATPAAPPGFAPNRAQGQSGTGGAAPLEEQIRAAEKSGNLSLSIALKQQKHAQLRQQATRTR